MNGTVNGGHWQNFNQPNFVAIETDGRNKTINNSGWWHDCNGYIGVPAVSNCDVSFPTTQRLCHCSSGPSPSPPPPSPPPGPPRPPCPPYSAVGCGPSDWNPKYYPPLAAISPPCSCADESLCGPLKSPEYGSRKETQAFFNTPMNAADTEWANESVLTPIFTSPLYSSASTLCCLLYSDWHNVTRQSH